MSAVCIRLDKLSPRGKYTAMDAIDSMPALVRAFTEEGTSAEALLREFMRHVAKVARPYPDAYFALGQKSEDAVDDLGNRAFSVCASVPKGRFPFSERTPFGAYVEEQFDGRTIRYHSFYAKLAITREIMRDDYAFNLRRDPVLRWRAELYSDIGAVLKADCEAVPQGRGVPPKWQRPSAGMRMLRPPEVVVARLRQFEVTDIETLVHAALDEGGPQTQSKLTHMLEAVLGAPSTDEPEPGYTEDHTADRMGVREAVKTAWEDLEDGDRWLMIALARGDAYEDLIAAHPQLNNKVAVSRAVSRVGKHFLERVIAAVGGEAAPDATPRTLLEPIMAMLAELYPADFS